MPSADAAHQKKTKNNGRKTPPYIMVRGSEAEIAEINDYAKDLGFRYPAQWARTELLKLVRAGRERLRKNRARH